MYRTKGWEANWIDRKLVVQRNDKCVWPWLWWISCLWYFWWPWHRPGRPGATAAAATRRFSEPVLHREEEVDASDEHAAQTLRQKDWESCKVSAFLYALYLHLKMLDGPDDEESYFPSSCHARSLSFHDFLPTYLAIVAGGFVLHSNMVMLPFYNGQQK